MNPPLIVGPLEVKTPSVRLLVGGATTIFFSSMLFVFFILHTLVFPAPSQAVGTLAKGMSDANAMQRAFIASTPTPSPIPTATPTPTPAFFKPVHITIPKLGVDTLIEDVGVTAEGAMDTPKDFNQVGWFALGAKPGDMGSAVFAGHLDTQTGAPAIFYYLSQMAVGDEFQIQDETGKTLTFRVYNTASYPENAFPLADVFEKTDGRYVNLITCHGIWQYGSHTYSDRFVVSAILVE